MRKIEYYVDLQNREENRLEVKMQRLQKSKNMTYEREINELKEKYNIDIKFTGENVKKTKQIIKNKIKKINDEEIEEEIKKGKKTYMMKNYNKKYIEKLHFKEARAIFMMITRMIYVKANYKNNYKNLECDICNVEENTQHLFKCKSYHELNVKIKGETLQEILEKNNENDIANILKEIIRRKEKEFEKDKLQKKITNTAPLPVGLSLLDGRV